VLAVTERPSLNGLNKMIKKTKLNLKGKGVIILLSALAILIVLIIIISGFTNLKTKSTVLKEPEKDVCENIGEIDEYGFNIVFFNDGYEDKNEFNADLTRLISSMKNIEPFKSFDNINFFKIENSDQNVCSVKETNSRRSQVKCSTEINKYLKKCNLDNFKLIVLTKDKSISYSVISKYKNSLMVLSKPGNGVSNNVFLHELGHLFGLVDEKATALGPVSADSLANKPSRPNCAPDIKTAEIWWKDYLNYSDVGFYPGCAGNEQYIKPTESSIMSNNFGSGYGRVSTDYMKQVLNCCYMEKPDKSCEEFYENYPEFNACLLVVGEEDG